MRIFWVIVAVVILVGAGIPLVNAARARSEAAAQRAAAERAVDQAKLIQDTIKVVNGHPDPDALAESAKTPADAAGSPPTVPVPKQDIPPASSTNANSDQDTATAPSVEPNPASAASKIETAPATIAETVPPTPAAEKPPAESPAPVTAVVAPVVKEPAPPPPAPALSAAPQTAPASAAKIVKKDDGSIVIDDKYTVKGDGTEANPYQLSWELLTSIQESYDPRVGKKTLPERLTMFDNKYIQLTGYVAFPLFVEEPKELLSMLNQWDGCCIGVPPTPYDAVEVHLKEVVSKDQRLAVFGTVQGKFQVKPYLAGDWLVGLYILEEAKVAAKEVGGFGT